MVSSKVFLRKSRRSEQRVAISDFLHCRTKKENPSLAFQGSQSHHFYSGGECEGTGRKGALRALFPETCQETAGAEKPVVEEEKRRAGTPPRAWGKRACTLTLALSQTGRGDKRPRLRLAITKA